MAIQKHKWSGNLKGLALFASAAIAVMCATSQGCSQRTSDDQEDAEVMAEASAARQRIAERQKAESVRQQQLADEEAQALARDESAFSIETMCQQLTLYVGSIAQARDNGVSLDKVLHTIHDEMLHTIDESNVDPDNDQQKRDFNADAARIVKAEESKTAPDIYKHREISPVKFQDRAYRECVDEQKSYQLKRKKEEEMKLKLPGL